MTTRYSVGLLCAAAMLAAFSTGDPVQSTVIQQQTDDDRLRISAEAYRNKVYASWLGQLVGNFYGLPHENAYVDEPRPDSLSEFKYRGWPLDRLREVNGAFSDDDTDIEYMYLLQMQRHGIEPTYAQLSEAWMYHVRDRVWLANRAAVTSMHYGFLPPATGSMEYNPHWFQIDPQLVNEIWAVTSPGMVDYATAKSLWAGRITNDDWGIEPTIHYAAMYAAAFFEKDVNRLIDIGLEALPPDARFAQTIADVRDIHRRYPDPTDWRAARTELSDKYYVNEPTVTKTMWNANLNGACAILALLYGDGDFGATLDMSTALGFDADNQAATMSGLLGIVHGMDVLPEEFLLPFVDLDWEKPFNDMYVNVSRHDLPDTSISSIVDMTVAQAEKIIVANGGEVVEEDGETYYLINPTAAFTPPLEMARVPTLIFEEGRPVNHDIVATIPNDELMWDVDQSQLPSGLIFERGSITGTPSQNGKFALDVTATHEDQKKTVTLAFTVLGENMATEADNIIAHVKEADIARRDKMWITVGRNLLADDVSIINDGKWRGDGSVFYSVNPQKYLHQDFYGYVWTSDQEIGNVVFRTGTMEENGAWFQSLRVEFQDESGQWKEASGLTIFPEFDTTNLELNKAHYIDYLLQFRPVSTKAIRIIGRAGGGSHWQESSRDIFYTSITELSVHAPLPRQH